MYPPPPKYQYQYGTLIHHGLSLTLSKELTAKVHHHQKQCVGISGGEDRQERVMARFYDTGDMGGGKLDFRKYFQ